jgi:hypothetical protein
MPLAPERWPPADNPAPLDAGPPQAEPGEQLLANQLSADRANASAARTRALAVLRRLRRYDYAAYRSVARLSAPLLDEPLRRVSGYANFSKPWFITAGFLALFGGPRGRRAALTGLAAVGATSLAVNQPVKLIGERHRPDRGRTWRTAAAMGHHALVDVFPVRSLGVRRRVRRCRRRPAAGAQASVAWRSVGRGIFPRVHRRALSERRSRRRNRGRAPRPDGLDSGAPYPWRPRPAAAG